MQSENTAAATALVPSEPEANQEIALGIGLSPAALKLKIRNDREMRKILTDYVREELVEGHHFSGSIGTQKLKKPMLLDEGARNICALFNLFFGEPKIEETWLDGGHYRVRVHIGIFNRRGEQVASGDALCSTLEPKYAFRGAERVCPKCGTAAIRKDNKKAEGGWYCWSKLDGCGAQFPAGEESITSQQIGRVDNPDIADAQNTVLKVGIKRAKTAAVRDVPTVSEIFAEGDAPSPAAESASPTPGRASAAVRTSGTHSKAQPSPVPPTAAKESAVDVVVALIKKLTDRGVDIADLNEQFLPGGVSRFEDLTDEAADDIRNDLVALLNAKLAETRGK